uniref:NADH-ubiquinone oxidoreductase chain 3 n=1 Tax=Caryophyllaeus laticeps TaxID=70618 RepID=H9YU26_9CEST|nr:NADH dehydrogenase subunit 3 [Caryophyllaeus laticeps]
MFIVLGLCVLFMGVAGAVLLGGSATLSRCVCSNGSWASPYECGFIPSSPSFDSFSFSYFSLLVFFVGFDLEISLLLNMPEQDIQGGSFFSYFLFLLIVSLGFFVESVCGYIRWGY